MSLGFRTSFWWVLVLEQWSNSKKSASIMSNSRWFLRRSRTFLFMASGITSTLMRDSLRYVHARFVRNALAGNLSPSLTACDTRPRWPCTRWLIGALLLLAFCPQVFIWELVCRWPLGYWPPITVLGDQSPDLSANWSVGGHLATDHRSPLWMTPPPWPFCHPIHVSPYEWSTLLSSADVINYRWLIGSGNVNGKTIPFVVGRKKGVSFRKWRTQESQGRWTVRREIRNDETVLWAHVFERS